LQGLSEFDEIDQAKGYWRLHYFRAEGGTAPRPVGPLPGADQVPQAMDRKMERAWTSVDRYNARDDRPRTVV